MAKQKRRIWVDADACPVKENIVEMARPVAFPAVFVVSYAHDIRGIADGSLVRVVQIEQAPQAVDLYIVNHVQEGDLVVTDDYGLASLVLAKGCLALSFRGKRFSKDQMDSLLQQRYFAQKARRSGKRLKGPKAFDRHAAVRFEIELNRILHEMSMPS